MRSFWSDSAIRVWHVMARLNWSAQKPERQARERDAEAVQTWRTRDWARIKKRPA